MYEWIDNILIGLLETYGTNNIYDLLESLNIEINKLDPGNILLNGNEAFYFRDYCNKEIVFIRNDLSEPYEKFILAHELGHALLHTNNLEAAFNRDLLNTGKLERQANYFGIKLLNLDIDPIECDGYTIEQIAHILEVPEVALKQIINL